MKQYLKRSDYSILGQWRWTIDFFLLIASITMIVLGVLMSLTASPAIAQRIGLDDFHFVYRQAVFACISIVFMLGISFLSIRNLLIFASFVFIVSLVTMALLPFIGFEANGAIRWLSVPLLGVSVQPSEFIKPSLAIVIAYLLTSGNFAFVRSVLLSLLLAAVVLFLLFIQPDIGMFVIVFCVTFLQLYIAGLSVKYFLLMFIVFVLPAALFVWNTQDHVRSRITSFWQDDISEQIQRSLSAMKNGGFFGVGPGNGTIKMNIPDSHTDFILAVIAEEFGFLFLMIIIIFIAIITIRPIFIVSNSKSPFQIVATFALCAILALQAALNIGVNLGILPPKGITLPFISYGGSSLIAASMIMGMILSLSRKRPWDYDENSDSWKQ